MIQDLTKVPEPAANFLLGGGDMGALMRSTDWSKTLLGPLSSWPSSLRTAVSICLNSRFPILLWWGQDLIMLYNDAYRPVLGSKKHPRALGQRGQEIWPEIWDIIGPMLEGVMARGQATWSEDLLLILDRNIYPEECYFTFSYSPIRDESRGTVGIFTAVTETTRRVISERRLAILQNLAVNTSVMQTLQAACDVAVNALANDAADIPFALLYLQDPEGRELYLAGSLGIQAGAPAAPPVLALDQAEQTLGSWPVAQVLAAHQPVLIDDLRMRFPTLEHNVHLHPVRSALILPVARSSQEPLYGCLIAGLSPIRPFDESFRGFLDLVAGQIAAAIANVSALEEERRRAEALAQLDRAKTRFFSNVSHEFRTPLTLMLGPVRDALAQPEGAGGLDRAALELINRNGLRLLKLVNTLLDFSRIEAGRLEAVFEPVDLAVLTADLASVFRSAIERAELRLQVECQSIPAPVYVDRDMWEKIVLNLLSNAFKFTLEGEIAVRLAPVERPSGLAVELTVCDTGVGIRPADIDHLFERFYRGSQAQARTHEGSGIGLALVKELVRLHAGTIQVASAPGEGSTFTVTLPTGTAHLPAGRIHASPALLSTALGAAPFVEEALRWLPDAQVPSPQVTTDFESLARPQPAPQAQILVVDDNADMREYLRRLLSARWTVVTASDGRVALHTARQRPPDLVLADIMMPGLDGYELLKELRNDPQTWELPVILLSAMAGEQARLHGLEAGADDYLVKPFSARELLARVEARLELATLRSASEREITRVLHELERSNQELEAFAYIVSHDLKEPLRKIKTFGDLLEEHLALKLAPQELDYFDRMQDAAARMSRMIQDLLEYSRVTLETRPATSVNLNEVVSTVLDDLGAHIDRSQGQVEVGELPTLQADSLHMQQLFQNLVGNALKFHRPGVLPFVKVYRVDRPGQGSADGFVEIVVEDNGIGFAPEYAERLFQPFQRLHRRDEYEGNGIGLAICRKIVERYDGKIRAHGELDRGAKFILSFPLQRVIE